MHLHKLIPHCEHFLERLRHKVTGDDILDVLGAAVITVAVVGEGCNTSGLGTTAALAYQIIRSLKRVRKNKRDALELAQAVGKCVHEIAAAYNKDVATVDDDVFHTNVNTINETSAEILSMIKKIALRRWWKRFLRQNKDKRCIEEAKSKLEYALSRFKLANSIMMVQEVREVQADIDALNESINTHSARAVHEVQADIRALNKNINASFAHVDNRVRQLGFEIHQALEAMNRTAADIQRREPDAVDRDQSVAGYAIDSGILQSSLYPSQISIDTRPSCMKTIRLVGPFTSIYDADGEILEANSLWQKSPLFSSLFSQSIFFVGARQDLWED